MNDLICPLCHCSCFTLARADMILEVSCYECGFTFYLFVHDFKKEDVKQAGE